jgi:hypothetical protein
MVITKTLTKIENQFACEISLAKANGYHGVLISSDGEYDLIYLEDTKDKEYILDMAFELGWDKFFLVDISGKQNKSKFFNLSLLSAA